MFIYYFAISDSDGVNNFIYWILIRNYSKLGNEDYKNKYGDLYEGINLGKAYLFYNIWFVVRRLILAISLFLMRDFVVIQLAILNIGSFVTVQYLIVCRPFEDETSNKVEIFNEIIILLISYLCWVFTDFQDNIAYLM